MANERLAEGCSVYDFYQTVDAMIVRLQELAVETLEVLTAQNGKNGKNGSRSHALAAGTERIQQANLKLFEIGRQMRMLARSLDGLLHSDDGGRDGLTEVLSICFTMSRLECILEVRMGKPRKPSPMIDQCGIDFVINGSSIHEGADGSFPLAGSAEDYRQLLSSLLGCRLELRNAIANAILQPAR